MATNVDMSPIDFIVTRRSVLAANLTGPGPSDAELLAARTPNNAAAVLEWENFFNNPNKKSQLVSRYIFDHIFSATIVLEESPGDYFRLVRSKTPPAKAGASAPTVRACQRPGRARCWSPAADPRA